MLQLPLLPLLPLLGFLLFSNWARQRIGGYFHMYFLSLFMAGSRWGTERLVSLFDTLAADLLIEFYNAFIFDCCLPEFWLCDIVINVYIIIVQQEYEVHSLVTILSSSI